MPAAGNDAESEAPGGNTDRGHATADAANARVFQSQLQNWRQPSLGPCDGVPWPLQRLEPRPKKGEAGRDQSGGRGGLLGGWWSDERRQLDGGTSCSAEFESPLASSMLLLFQLGSGGK